MIRTLKPGNQFLDIGSHFGYYSRLALQLIGQNGLAVSIEPSESTFEILQLNLKNRPNAICLNAMAGEKPGLNQFYQFPTLYSEYNTAHPEQFSNSEWFKKTVHHAYPVITTTVDEIVIERKLSPAFIKIDTEGSEGEVIKGSIQTLSKFPGIILAMEFLSNARSNQSHTMAARILEEKGFHPFLILNDGTLKECADIENHLSEKKMDSDNIIFKRHEISIL